MMDTCNQDKGLKLIIGMILSVPVSLMPVNPAALIQITCYPWKAWCSIPAKNQLFANNQTLHSTSNTEPFSELPILMHDVE